MLARNADWLRNLNKVVEDARARPFDWATWDCCRFVSEAVEAMTGTCINEGFDYSTEEEAWAQIGTYGGLRHYLTHTLGPWHRPAFAQRGEVMLAKGGKAVGICMGQRVAIVTEEAGFQMLPISEFAAAFPLGWPDNG